MDMYDCVQNMMVVLANGGLGSGGFNFDAKVRRESTDLEDLFLGHIGGMDAYARALVIADRIVRDGRIEELKAARYASFGGEAGRRFEAGELGLADLRDLAADSAEPANSSGKQELVENLLNDYMFS
jgi:xylose isomerase